MACATAVPSSPFLDRDHSIHEACLRLSLRKQPVRILNPMPGGSGYTSPDRAIRFLKAGRAYLDACDRLVFYGESTGKSSAGMDVVDRFSGIDAFPDRAVFPPSGEVMSKLSSRRALRPPVRN